MAIPQIIAVNRCVVFRSIVVSLSACGLAARGPASEPIDFDRDARPVLSESCYPCHGPDRDARQADLRLDTREGLFSDRGDFRIVVPARPNESELFRRITAADRERMPPAESGLSLTDPQIEVIHRWIEEGAQWKGHWAFDPPARPALPSLADDDWPLNEIDYFVRAKLKEQGLDPSPEACRETLIRRVTLDLTGLPPTLAEVDAFVQDESQDAYEKVVDRLLASPRYGERMAWEWLDAARYADTDGFQGDPTREMWPWRDWLIGALNDNMPFDQFTIQLLAGDLLPEATPEQIVATGFNRNHMYNGEGGRIAEETRVENVFDRTETTSTIWLGLTMTCARCHDHKFDPITQEEYYRFYAFFNNTSESGQGGGGRAAPTLEYLTPNSRERLEDLNKQIAELNKMLDNPMPEMDSAQAAWEAEIAAQLAESPDGPDEVILSDWSVLGTLPAPGGDSSRAFQEDLGPEQGVDLEQTYLDGKLAWRTQPRFVDGKVHLLPSVIGATYLYRTIESPGSRSIHVSLGSDDGIRVWINGHEALSNDTFRVAAPDQEQVTLELRPGTNALLVKIVNRDGGAGFYFRKTGEVVAGLPREVAKILSLGDEQRSAAEQQHVRRFFREHHSEAGRQLHAELTRLQEEREAIDQSAATVMIMDSLPPDQNRETFILERGTYNKPQGQVSAGTPDFLPPLPADAPHDRLTLARWLVDPANPLPARVTVNRYWQAFFGTGIVETSEDFGRQGSRPSHPQLLDWLATRFIDSGWDVKGLHKLIVMSATYRQSSRVRNKDRDSMNSAFPNPNSALHAFPRTRMPSWMLRDQALAVSGLLTEKIGGPPVKPYQPAGIWAEATFGKIRYEPDTGENLYRRSIYIFWRRIVGPTMLFDAGKRQTCEVRPTVTNTPLHALTTLNETLFVEASRTMAERIMTTAETPEERIQRAFRLVTARHPSPEERALLVRRLEWLTNEFRAHPDEAAALLAVGDSPRDMSLDAAEHAAYATLCGLLLNLDETLTRE
jgi:hypothetical protein